MFEEQRVAYIRAQTVSAECELAGMLAENAMAIREGIDPPFSKKDFDSIPERFGITHNQVIGYLTMR